MKKSLFTTLLMLVAMIGLQSCKSVQNVAKSSATLNGEWEIVEINGMSVVPAEHQPFPYIGFDISESRFYGSSGCNRMMGSYKLGSKEGSISFGQVAGTLMACPDMEIEARVHKMLESVKSFKKLNEDQIGLYGSGKKAVAVLTVKKEANVALALSKKWVVETIDSKSVMNDLENEKSVPFIKLDVENNTIHGNAGCNVINGELMLDKAVNNGIRFDKMAVTRMFCPNMSVENSFLKCLNTAFTYKLSDDGLLLTLYDVEGSELATFVQVEN